MSTRFSSNEKLIDALEKAVAHVEATGDISIIQEESESSDELILLVRQENYYGYDIRNNGFKDIKLIHHGRYLSDVIINKKLLSLDYNLMKHIEKEVKEKIEMLYKIKEQQEAQYWADVAAGLYD